MAILNLSITIPDAQLPRVQAAMVAAYGPMTNPQMIEKLRQETILTLKQLVFRYERAVLAAAAEAPSTDLDAT